MKKSATRAAAIAACSTLAVAFLPATTATAAGEQNFEEARSSLMAAGYSSAERAADEGYYLTVKADYNLNASAASSSEMRIDAWTSWTGEAAIKYRDSELLLAPKQIHQGSNIRWFSSNLDFRSWNEIFPASKHDAKVMKQLPRGTRFSTGPTPTVPYWETVGFGLTSDTITRNLSLNGYLPWDVAAVIALCGESEPPIRMDCTGGVETISGKEKVWTFQVVRTLGSDPNSPTETFDITAYSDFRGNIVEVEYIDDTRGSLTRTVSEVSFSPVGIPSPPRALSKNNSVSSKRLTSEAAAVGVKGVVSEFRAAVKQVLADAGKSLTSENALWAYRQLFKNGYIFNDTNQWARILGTGAGLDGFEFSLDATDGITKTTRYAEVIVKDGKFQTTFSDSRPNEMVASELTKRDIAASDNRLSLARMPWAAPGK